MGRAGVRAVVRPTEAELLPLYQELLPVALIGQLVRATGKRFYVRLFSPLVVVWGLIYQRLHSDHSCDAVVSALESGAMDHLVERPGTAPLSARLRSSSTAGYCQARQRLPVAVMRGVLRHTVETVPAWAGEQGRWCGRLVRLLDGSTILLRPEPELVAHYGQHANGHGCTYWVLMRVLVSFCLRTGLVTDLAEAPLNRSEQDLSTHLLAQAEAGTLFVGDSNFGVFSVAQAIRHYQHDALLRLTLQRAQSLLGRRPTPGDYAVAWAPKSSQRDPEMAQQPIAGRLIVECVQPSGFRPFDLCLFTTLREAQQYPAASLLELYGWRWQVELHLRHVKQTLDLHLINAKSVDMVRKELLAGLVAYNLIRAFMLKAALQAKIPPLRLSFSACWRRLREFLLHPHLPSTLPRHTRLARLVARLARCLIPPRAPGRLEPRAVRGLPRVYPPLKGSRHDARQRLLDQRRRLAAA